MNLTITFAIILALSCAAGAARGEVARVWVSSQDMKHTLAPGDPLPLVDKGAIPAARPVIEVAPQQTYQSILGLGASLEHTTCYNLSQLGPEKMDEVIERIVDPVNGIGMNLMRICIGTPDFTGEPWYSYDDMPPGKTDEKLEHFSIEKDKAYVLPVLRKALEKNPDLLFYASPWSPPGWMTSTDDMIGGHLLPQYYGAYARYFVRFIQAYAAEGIPIYAVTPQNEPGVNTRNYPARDWYPSCQWSLIVDEDNFWPVDFEAMGRNEADFITQHLGPALKQHGIAARIWCYDHNINNLWYPRNILGDPGAAQYVDGAGFHAYAGSPDALTGFHDEFPDKHIYFTEGSAPGVRGAMRIVSLFRNWCRSYNAWVIMIDYDGNPNNGPFRTTRTCIQPRRDGSGVDYHFEYYTYGQFMKFIKRGAVRIGSTEGTREFANVAFVNPDGEIVLVVVNQAATPTAFNVICGDRAFEASMPAQSVATFCWPQ
ncbi:MAG: glycosyl hydrolase [Armatimonadota bacterium]|nr:MAG: glycosyl hydrolase [Armatimonadota bacterium]